MGMMLGFSQHRRGLLQAELARIAGELPALGGRGTLLLRDLFGGPPLEYDAELELVIVLHTDEPFHRRADFLVSHLRPRVGTRFLVYTPAEFDELREIDPLLRWALAHGQVVDEPA